MVSIKWEVVFPFLTLWGYLDPHIGVQRGEMIYQWTLDTLTIIYSKLIFSSWRIDFGKKVACYTNPMLNLINSISTVSSIKFSKACSFNGNNKLHTRGRISGQFHFQVVNSIVTMFMFYTKLKRWNQWVIQGCCC